MSPLLFCLVLKQALLFFTKSLVVAEAAGVEVEAKAADVLAEVVAAGMEAEVVAAGVEVVGEVDAVAPLMVQQTIGEMLRRWLATTLPSTLKIK